MTPDQLKLFISGAFGSEADAQKISKLLNPYLAAALAEIRSMIELLPDESLTRERLWRSMLPEIERIFAPYSASVAVVLERELPFTGEKAAEETLASLRSAGVPIPAGSLSPVDVIADSNKYFLATKINDKRLVDLFTPKDGTSPFSKSSRRMVDQIVRGGILTGESTEKIAKMIETELPKRMQGQQKAIARTAIQDYNRQVKEDVWRSNGDVIKRLGLKYEWVAALDSRTCPTCAPLDGEVKDAKSDFPSTPVHVNCRCTVVIVDPEDEGQIRTAQVISDKKLDGQGTYKTKVKVKGEKFYRQNRAVDLVNGKSPRYADWLAQLSKKDDLASRQTLAEFFGGGKAGADRAAKFRKAVRASKDPRQALIDLTFKTKNARRFKASDA